MSTAVSASALAPPPATQPSFGDLAQWAPFAIGAAGRVSEYWASVLDRADPPRNRLNFHVMSATSRSAKAMGNLLVPSLLPPPARILVSAYSFCTSRWLDFSFFSNFPNTRSRAVAFRRPGFSGVPRRVLL